MQRIERNLSTGETTVIELSPEEEAEAMARAATLAIVTPGRVKAEAQRRIIGLVGMTDLQSCILRQLNMLMRATELANKRAMGIVLTAGETTEANALQSAADQIKAIRTKSNEIEALSPIPADYADNARWA